MCIYTCDKEAHYVFFQLVLCKLPLHESQLPTVKIIPDVTLKSSHSVYSKLVSSTAKLAINYGRLNTIGEKHFLRKTG